MAEIKIDDFLKAIKFDPATLTGDDVTLESVVEDFHNSQKTHWFEIFKNSDDYKAGLNDHEGKVYAKHSKIIDGAIKKAGLQLTDEQARMKPQEKIELLAQHLQNTNSGTKEIQDLQRELIEWKNKYTSLESEAETKVKNALSEADKKLLSGKAELHLKNKFISVPKEKLVGNEHLDIHWIGLDAKLKEKYDVSFDDKGELVFYAKGTQQLVQGKKDGRDVILTADEIIQNQLKENKSWVESNGKGGQQQQQTQQRQTVLNKQGYDQSADPAKRLAELQAIVANGQG